MHFFRMISLILLGLHGTHALPAQRLASRQSSPESGPQRWMDWFQQVSAWTLRHQGEILVAAGTLGSALLAKKVLIWQLTREGNSKLTWDLEISPENRLKMREEIMRSLARKNLPPEFVDCFARKWTPEEGPIPHPGNDRLWAQFIAECRDEYAEAQRQGAAGGASRQPGQAQGPARPVAESNPEERRVSKEAKDDDNVFHGRVGWPKVNPAGLVSSVAAYRPNINTAGMIQGLATYGAKLGRTPAPRMRIAPI